MEDKIVPQIDAEEIFGLALVSHLRDEHGHNFVLMRFMREWERLELHKEIHEGARFGWED